jgi:hypothetical protein
MSVQRTGVLAVAALVVGLVGVAGAAPWAGAAPAGQVIAVSPGDTDAQILDKAASVVPTDRQQAWQQMELTAFDHFGPNTFTGREVGSGTEDPDVFDPSSLDTDQWMRSLRDAGFKQAILTVKHHDGFLWQVDLGESAPIGTINIYNRTDCCAERLSDYWVFTSDTPFDTTRTPDEQAATPGVWSTHETTRAGVPTQLTVGATGRYVMVQQNSPTVLSLAEVEVMRG